MLNNGLHRTDFLQAENFKLVQKRNTGGHPNHQDASFI